MDFAKERPNAEKLIRASDALPGRYYTCPACFADVFLRRGRRRVTHFAHRAGQGKPDCENFHPSHDLIYAWPGYGSSPANGPGYHSIDPLILSIELQPESTMRGKKLRAWELRLTVPKSEDAHGQIRIDCGNGLTRTFRLANLTLAPKTCNIDVSGEDFGAIWVSPEVSTEYKAVVEHRIPGLDRQQATLFASSTSSLKPHVDRVSWGNSYYIIWHTTHDIGMPTRLLAQPLATVEKWNCALITLPDDEDPELKTWIEEVTAVAISAQPRLFGVVYPPPCGFDVAGEVILPAGEQVIVGLKQKDSGTDTTVVLNATAGGTSSDVTLEGAGRHIVFVAQDTSRAQIAFRLNGAALPLLVPRSIPHTDVFFGVRLVFREVSGRSRTEATLGSKSGYALLEKVRSGQAEVSECKMPSGVKGTLWWKASNELVWSSMPLGQEGSPAAVTAGSSELAQINQRLQEHRHEVEIDFGAFGSFRALAEKHAEKALGVKIPLHARNRIYWLASTSFSFRNDRGVPFQRLSDEKLVHFVSRMRVNPHLIAHQRHLVAELRRLSTESTGR